jgi:SnoaL-like domain
VLAGSEPDFPPADSTATCGRRWWRAAMEAWAGAHPDHGPLHPGDEILPIGQWPWQVQAVVDLAHDEARALHHDWVSGDLAYTVELEHTSVSVDGAPIAPYTLRVTQVYRREDGEWRIVHRHGDQISIDGFTDAYTVFTIVAALAALLSLRLVPSGKPQIGQLSKAVDQ